MATLIFVHKPLTLATFSSRTKMKPADHSLPIRVQRVLLSFTRGTLYS